MEKTFFITPVAAKKISELLKMEPTGSKLRISVQGGGCSGFQYNFLMDNTFSDDDTIFSQDNINVVIDSTSLGLIYNATLDYVVDLSAEKFIITNPNAASACGCGNSFSI